MPDIDIRLLRKQLVKMFNEFNRMAADGDDVDKVLYRMATRWSDILITLNTSGITIDAALSGISENPVQNKVINQKITQILQALNSINDLAKAVLPADDKCYVIQNGVLVELPEGGSGSIYMRTDSGYIQWSNDNENWNNLIAIADLEGPAGNDGADGKEVQLQASETYIQWRYVGDESWTNLVALEDLKGDTGDPGQGLPSGGSTGQIARKKSASDYDVEWADESGGGHEILDKDGTGLTQREKLKFFQEVTDDGIDTTKVYPTFTKAGFGAEYNNGNSGASKTVDWNNGQNQKITLTADCTLTFTALADISASTFRVQLKVIQDGTGGWNLYFPVGTIFCNGAFDFSTGTASQTCLVGIYYDGTKYYVIPTLFFD